MNLVVIGGGASGMMCAISAAQAGAHVTVIEKNEKLGKKLYITGKGRCNLTNCTDFDDYMNNIVNNRKFMISSLREFDCRKCMTFFEESGLVLKTERGNRVFPTSDKSSDVIKTLTTQMKRSSVDVHLQEKATDITFANGFIAEVITDKATYPCDAVAICTGGKSYPLTGSTGDGYGLAQKAGHTVVSPKPSLCGLIVNEIFDSKFTRKPLRFMPKLQGLSLKNVTASVLSKNDRKVVFEEFGEMLFTDHGVSGPIILTLSSRLSRMDVSTMLLSIDLKPALEEKQLDERILRDFSIQQNKQLNHALDDLLPQSMIPFIIKLSGIPQEKKVNSVTKEERMLLVRLIKNLIFPIVSSEGFDRAIITSGGVDVKEINPQNMQSKIIPNLFFAGEILDVDALTGGFNLQIAFSTGYILGKKIMNTNTDRRKT